MAGEPKPQATAPAPDVSQAAPSAPLTTTGSQEIPKANPPESTPQGPEKATTPQQKQKEKPRQEAKRQGPQGPEPTAHKTEAELDAMLQAFEKGEPKVEDQKETTKKATTAKPAKAATAETDPLQKELDEAGELAAKAAGLTLAPKAGESTSEQADKEAPEDDKADEFQAWLDTLPKGAATKIQRLQKQNRELKSQATEQFKLSPTPANPLAHVSTEAELQAEKAHWSAIQSECQRLVRNGTADGIGEITLASGKKHTFQTDEEIQDYLSWADRVLNAIPDWKERLNDRAKAQPWETATKLAPDLFEKGSPSHTLALDVLTNVPAFKAAFPDYEVRLAHMARSMKMEEEAKPTKEFPHGKAKYVRLELDSEGRVIQPKAKAEAVAKPNTKPVTESAKETAPSIAKPALKVAVSGDDVRALQAKYEKSRSEDDLDALLRASERAA